MAPIIRGIKFLIGTGCQDSSLLTLINIVRSFRVQTPTKSYLEMMVVYFIVTTRELILVHVITITTHRSITQLLLLHQQCLKTTLLHKEEQIEVLIGLALFLFPEQVQIKMFLWVGYKIMVQCFKQIEEMQKPEQLMFQAEMVLQLCSLKM